MIREEAFSGLAAIEAATVLLQRARLADREAGLWEAADMQWWWRKPRPTDALAKPFWFDDDGPVAGIVPTDFGHGVQCDVLMVPDADVPDGLWERAFTLLDELRPKRVEVLCRADDHELLARLEARGLERGEPWWIMWQEPRAVGRRVVLPDGYALVDRASREDREHPMAARNHAQIAERLAATSLYDAGLDLCVEAPGGETAGYALFWFDPVTNVGLVEPMRVHEPYRRQGLATALLAEGLTRLVARGAERLKVSCESAAARDLYAGVGFEVRAEALSFVLDYSG